MTNLRSYLPGVLRRGALLLVPAAVLILSGCSRVACVIPRDPQGCGDRCYIEDETFLKADQLYGKFGTLDMVERHLLEEEQLRQCEVNECLYRLRKVHSLP